MAFVFFYLSKILSGLFFPLPLLLTSLLLVVLFYKHKHARKCLLISVLLLYGLSLYPVSGFLMFSLEKRYPALHASKMPSADAIVLLGGLINPMVHNRSKQPEFLGSVDRLFLAESLLYRKKAPVLIISGGSGFLLQKEAKEAVLLKKFLMERAWSQKTIFSKQILEKKILIEPNSRNTYENAKNTAELARKRGIQKILLVTSAFHMPRGLRCFEAQGFTVFPAPTDFYSTGSQAFPIEAVFPSPSALRLSTLAIKEYIGILAYDWAGYFDKQK